MQVRHLARRQMAAGPVLKACWTSIHMAGFTIPSQPTRRPRISYHSPDAARVDKFLHDLLSVQRFYCCAGASTALLLSAVVHSTFVLCRACRSPVPAPDLWATVYVRSCCPIYIHIMQSDAVSLLQRCAIADGESCELIPGPAGPASVHVLHCRRRQIFAIGCCASSPGCV
jgi:hypothetical protein